MKMQILLVFILCVAQTALGRLVDRSNRNINDIPDGSKNTADFCEKYGYKAEEHVLTTPDGYSLSIFRVPWGLKNTNKTGRIPVLMQHGIYLNSDQWVLRGQNDLPFLLAEEGYDVWMSNTRGTPYSKHRKYGRRTFKFWNYSPDELSGIDLKVFIDYILKVTKMPSLSYIGHSRGGAMPIMLLSSNPEYNNKVHLLQLLAPVVYSANITSPLYALAGKKPNTLMQIETLKHVVTASHLTTMLFIPDGLKSSVKFICNSGALMNRICPMFYFFINGEGSANFNYSMFPLFLDHFADGVSSKEIIHLLQIAESDRFQKFDYGRGNLAKYGSTQPPLYEIGKVTSPVHVYYGPNDRFISERDVWKFIGELQNFRSAFKVPYKMFNHLDYFWGLNTNEILFPRFIDDINRFHREMKNRLEYSTIII